MALNFLFSSDIAEQVIKKLEDDSKTSFSNMIEFINLLHNNKILFSDYFNGNVYEKKRISYVNKFVSHETAPYYENIMEMLYSEKNKDLCELLLKAALDEDNSLNIEQQFKKVSFFIELENKYHVFTKDEKNSFVVENATLVNLLSKSNFYQFSLDDLNNFNSLNELFPKIDIILKTIRDGGELNNNTLAFLPSIQSKFNKDIKNTEMVDFFYKKVSDIYGDKVLFNLKLNIENTIDSLDDYLTNSLDHINDGLNLVLNFNDVVCINFSSKIKKVAELEKIEPSFIATLSPSIAVDYLNSLSSKIQSVAHLENGNRGVLEKKNVEKALNSWFELYVNSIVYDKGNEYLKPIQKVIEIASQNKVSLGLHSIAKVLTEVKNVDDPLRVCVHSLLSNEIRIAKEKNSPNAFSFNNAKVVFNALEEFHLVEDKKDLFFDLFEHSLSKSVNAMWGTEENTYFKISKQLLDINPIVIRDVLNSSYCNGNLLDVSTYTDEDVRKDNIVLSLETMLFAIICDKVENHGNTNVFSTKEREKIVAIALSSDKILKRLPEEKMGNMYFFKKMLNNPKYADPIISAVANNIDNPIVREYMQNKNFKLVFSQAKNDLAQSILVKMQLDKKFAAIPTKIDDDEIDFKI